MPPEPVVRLGGADLHIVFAQSAQGHIYACDVFAEAGECWQKADQIATITDPYPCQFAATDILKPPGRIIDRIDVFFCGADTRVEANYALLSDGSIWHRGHGTYANGIACLFAYGSPAAAVLGLVMGPLLMRLFKYKTPPNNALHPTASRI
jgi:hypothetical protein